MKRNSQTHPDFSQGRDKAKRWVTCFLPLLVLLILFHVKGNESLISAALLLHSSPAVEGMASWPLWKFCSGAHFTQQFNYVEPFYRAQTPPSVHQCCSTRGFENVSVLQTPHLLSEFLEWGVCLGCCHVHTLNVQREPVVGTQSSLLQASPCLHCSSVTCHTSTFISALHKFSQLP